MRIDLVNKEFSEYSSDKNAVRIYFGGMKPIILSHIKSLELEMLLKINNKKLNDSVYTEGI